MRSKVWVLVPVLVLTTVLLSSGQQPAGQPPVGQQRGGRGGAGGPGGGIQYRSRLLHAAHGGSIENPMGKSLPSNITTLAAAIAAGITSAPAAPPAGGRGGGGAPNPWQVSGYQFDMDSGNSYTGGLYE